MKKKKFLVMATLALGLNAGWAADLAFDKDKYSIDTLAMPDGSEVVYKAYEGIPFVEKIEDAKYQTLNLYVPIKKCEGKMPILVRTYIGGYMATTAKTPSPTDATGRALQEGYMVCIPGSRGSNSVVEKDGKELYTGIAPNGLLDLKAAIRFLRHNKDRIEGDTELIFIDGTSAGGAMASLIGATANNPVYEPLLEAMGAAKERDDVYGAICYCPITDLNHADMEYEWLYGCTNDGVRHLDEAQKKISNELAALCPTYINSLSLKKQDGSLITADNYKEYLKSFLIASAHRALQEGCVIPDSIGIIFYNEKGGMDFPGGMGAPGMGAPRMGARTPQGDGRQAPSFGPGARPRFNRQSDFVSGIDLDKYLAYVASSQPLKTPPAFDSMGVLSPNASPENRVFGDSEGNPANFTDFSLQHRLKDPTATLSEEMQNRVFIMNPMNFIGDGQSTNAPHWYIRHGAKDRDTSFLVPINLATKLQNAGKDVDFFIPWNRPHSGDYNLDDLFKWINKVITRNK